MNLTYTTLSHYHRLEKYPVPPLKEQNIQQSVRPLNQLMERKKREKKREKKLNASVTPENPKEANKFSDFNVA